MTSLNLLHPVRYTLWVDLERGPNLLAAWLSRELAVVPFQNEIQGPLEWLPSA